MSIFRVGKRNVIIIPLTALYYKCDFKNNKVEPLGFGRTDLIIKPNPQFALRELTNYM
jgi:hypothetical protein